MFREINLGKESTIIHLSKSYSLLDKYGKKYVDTHMKTSLAGLVSGFPSYIETWLQGFATIQTKELIFGEKALLTVTFPVHPKLLDGAEVRAQVMLK